MISNPSTSHPPPPPPISTFGGPVSSSPTAPVASAHIEGTGLSCVCRATRPSGSRVHPPLPSAAAAFTTELGCLMWNPVDSGPQEFRAGQSSWGSKHQAREREEGLTPGCRKGRVPGGEACPWVSSHVQPWLFTASQKTQLLSGLQRWRGGRAGQRGGTSAKGALVYLRVA